MKRFVNVLVVFALLWISIFTGYTYAQSVDTNPVQITREWEIVWTYTWLSQAVNEAESWDVINLIEDISVTEASVILWKSLTINGDNHIITRESDITTITVNEGSSLVLKDIVITDNAVNFAPDRYGSLIGAKSNIPFCTWWVVETRNESWEVIASVCATESLDVAKTHPQIYSVGYIYGDNLTVSNSLNSQWSAAIIVEKWWIEMINSSFIHNWASGISNGWRGWAIRVWPNTATDIVDESPITKIIFSWCYFENNYGRTYGWAIAIHYAPEVVTIDNCVFSGNTAYSNWWAIQILNIWYKLGWSNASFWISTWSNFPIGTMYVNNSNFYNNWCGNDGSAIENDDIHLEINWSNFEHNYWTQPSSTSVWVVSCQAGSDEAGWDKTGRWGIYREYKINNSNFRDTNTVALWDHAAMWSFFVNNCVFENQKYVLLSRFWRWEIKNSTIKNSSVNCGRSWWYTVQDVVIDALPEYLQYIELFWENTLKLNNNIYSNDCTTNEYFQVRATTETTWINNIIIENEDNTRVFVNRSYYDSANIQWTDEIYYWATIDDWKYAYIKKDQFYNIDEFIAELDKFSYGNSGYELGSWKTMLFYLDDGYTELWSGSISTTTNLYWKETDIHNIIYEWMDGVDFEWITHTYKFNNLNHTQYLTELTPYELNTPSRNWYVFEWWYLDEEYVEPVISIEEGSIWDIRVYAKWTKKPGWYSGWWGRRVEPKDSEESLEDVEDFLINTDNDEEDEREVEVYPEEFNNAYEFAYKNGITTMDSIEEADMEGSLTRIAMAKMLSKYAVNILWMKPDETRNNKFRDVTDELDMDYDNWVKLAYQLGIMWINMKDNKFRPYDLVSRWEFVTALSRMVYHTSDGEYESTARYYTNHIATLEEKWIISNVKPDMQELRWYVMIMLMRSAKLSDN